MIAWSDVVAKFQPGDALEPLVGRSKLTVDSVDDERMCIRQRLWLACVTPADLQIADAILSAAPVDVTPVQLAELIREHYTAGADVTTECTRIPNLAAVVLYNLGALTSEQPALQDGPREATLVERGPPR